ncbi:unnamed protein product [Xylocopa violacea]|uniref:Uncharacterized protein n=1 Tax=Xylocopa violacea TaxID=135666 RepID=A0ABP1N4Z2_XYLVO
MIDFRKQEAKIPVFLFHFLSDRAIVKSITRYVQRRLCGTSEEFADDDNNAGFYVFGDTCVNSWISWFPALVAERNNADLNPSAVCPEHKWTTGITLASVFPTLAVTGA